MSRRLFATADALMAGSAAMGAWFRTLLLSGFRYGDLRQQPAGDQGEHLINHYADMLPDSARPFAFHGEQIGVTTMTSARLQERMLDGPAPVLLSSAETERFSAPFRIRVGSVMLEGNSPRSVWAEEKWRW